MSRSCTFLSHANMQKMNMACHKHVDNKHEHDSIKIRFTRRARLYPIVFIFVLLQNIHI